MAKHWFVEESMPDGSYRVIRRDMDEGEALNLLQSHPTTNRLEMWCDALANSPKGFAPAAYKANGRVMVGNTLAMLAGMTRDTDVQH
jgi:hypothetical protein